MPDDATLDQFASSAATESEEDADSEVGESEVEDSDVDESEAVESEADVSETDESDVGKSEVDESDVAESEVEDSEEESTVEPARSTYGWSPDGGECADCGESVERRWRADGQRDGELVCPDCKDW